MGRKLGPGNLGLPPVSLLNSGKALLACSFSLSGRRQSLSSAYSKHLHYKTAPWLLSENVGNEALGMGVISTLSSWTGSVVLSGRRETIWELGAPCILFFLGELKFALTWTNK